MTSLGSVDSSANLMPTNEKKRWNYAKGFLIEIGVNSENNMRPYLLSSDERNYFSMYWFQVSTP